MQTPVMFIKNTMMQPIKLVECKEGLETNMYKIMYRQLVILEKLTQKSWSEPKCEAHYIGNYSTD